MHIRMLLSLALAVLVSGLAPAAFAQQLLYIYADHLNTPRLVSNAAGTAVWRWDQIEPFGDNLPNEDPDGNSILGHLPLRFPGQYFDKETNLHYNYFRDYDPVIGRYIQSDPIGLLGGMHLYAYALHNPLRNMDPFGLEVTMTCRPVAAAAKARMSSPVHCAVIVWHYDECGRKVIDAQYSLPGGGTSPTGDPNDPTYSADKTAFENPGGTNTNYPIPAPPGKSQSDFDQAVINSGNIYTQGPYWPLTGPNSNTAASNIISNAGGTPPNIPNAWGQSYQPGGSVGDIIAP